MGFTSSTARQPYTIHGPKEGESPRRTKRNPCTFVRGHCPRTVLPPRACNNVSIKQERAGYGSQIASAHGADCALSADAETQRCYGTVRGLGLNLSQTLWSYQAFNQLKEANFQAAAAEATFRGAEQSLLLRVAQAYFGILSASDQLATNRSEREAFSTRPSAAAPALGLRSRAKSPKPMVGEYISPIATAAA